MCTNCIYAIPGLWRIIDLPAQTLQTVLQGLQRLCHLCARQAQITLQGMYLPSRSKVCVMLCVNGHFLAATRHPHWPAFRARRVEGGSKLPGSNRIKPHLHEFWFLFFRKGAPSAGGLRQPLEVRGPSMACGSGGAPASTLPRATQKHPRARLSICQGSRLITRVPAPFSPGTGDMCCVFSCFLYSTVRMFG